MEEWWCDGHGFNLCVAPLLVNQLYINFRDTKNTGGRQNKEAGIYKGFYSITNRSIDLRQVGLYTEMIGITEKVFTKEKGGNS